jgi:hypothetical protein
VWQFEARLQRGPERGIKPSCFSLGGDPDRGTVLRPNTNAIAGAAFPLAQGLSSFLQRPIAEQRPEAFHSRVVAANKDKRDTAVLRLSTELDREERPV